MVEDSSPSAPHQKSSHQGLTSVSSSPDVVPPRPHLHWNLLRSGCTAGLHFLPLLPRSGPTRTHLHQLLPRSGCTARPHLLLLLPRSGPTWTPSPSTPPQEWSHLDPSPLVPPSSPSHRHPIAIVSPSPQAPWRHGGSVPTGWWRHGSFPQGTGRAAPRGRCGTWRRRCGMGCCSATSSTPSCPVPCPPATSVPVPRCHRCDQGQILTRGVELPPGGVTGGG